MPPLLTGHPVTTVLPEACDYLAPDGSEIRLLPEVAGGGLCHCALPAGHTSRAVRHRTVDEIWYVLSGDGEVWREGVGEQPLGPGTSLTIPRGVGFQFRAVGGHPLQILIATTPRWPGPEDAVEIAGPWASGARTQNPA
jgi:mannose-6-phosphate isomerase-like protein (cupin superfamily)